ALLGLGGVARQSHFPGYQLEPAASRLEIVAALDPSLHAEPLPGVPLVHHRRDLAALGPIDFVDICTPTSSHLDLTLWALEQGWHVLCEKPVAISRSEAEEIGRAARRAGRVVMPCHQYRYNPVWRRVKGWLEADAIGRWHLAELDVYRLHADRGSSADVTPWRARADQSRGGVLLDHGTHLVYELLDLAGEPTSVHAWTGRLRHWDYDVEDSAHLLLEFPGRLAKIFLTWAAQHRENRIRFIGDRGTIEWLGGLLTLEVGGRVERFDHSAQLEKSAYARWYADLFAAFTDSMDTGDTAPLDDIAAVAAVLDAAYFSARLPSETGVIGVA
ncbi:MAG: Gfo/Idh/MocA family protein, partial [Gemmatimonadales bacterium]